MASTLTGLTSKNKSDTFDWASQLSWQSRSGIHGLLSGVLLKIERS
jgi:hypothetical protein